MSDSTPFLTGIKPDDQRPEHPDFWCKRFQAGTMPWDAGKVPAEFNDYARSQGRPLTTLIPGCGSGWEAALLADLGWPVTALDFSPAAVERAREVLGDAAVDLVCGDFFNWSPAKSLDLIYERAFLCALPRKMWADWGRRVAELLPSGAHLAGFFFVCDQLKGPPFGISEEQLADLLSPNFERLEDAPAAESTPVFAGRERWQVWRRR